VVSSEDVWPTGPKLDKVWLTACREQRHNCCHSQVRLVRSPHSLKTPFIFLTYSSLTYSSITPLLLLTHSSFTPHALLNYSSCAPHALLTYSSFFRSSPNPDVFIVRHDCSCWTSDKPCWRQQYTGLLCKHALLTVVERVQMCTCRAEKEAIYRQVIDFCNPNWHRRSYDSKSRVWISDPPHTKSLNSTCGVHDGQFVSRFKEVIRFLPPQVIHEHLTQLECLLLEPGTRTRNNRVRPPTTTSDNIQQYSNPTKRRKSKLDFTKISDDA